MKLNIDPAECMGHGRCYRIAPDLLSYDDEGYVAVRGELINVPADQVEFAREAEGSCPEGAIIVLED